MSPLLILANLAGYIGIIFLIAQFVMGTRHVFKYFTTNTVALSQWHKALGQYGIVFLLLHPILSMFARSADWSWLVTPNFSIDTETSISLGRFAVVLFLIVWITSALVRHTMRWRPWKYIHLLSYPLLVLSLIHLTIGTFYDTFSIIHFVWSVALVAVVSLMIVRLLAWAGFFKMRYELVRKQLIGSTIYEIKLKPLGKKVGSRMGQHFFLQSGPFKSEHPFSVLSNTDGVLTFDIRQVGDFWNTLQRAQIGDTLLLDGPYGVFTREAQNDRPKVIIAAGVGVTPFVELVQQYGKNTIFINCNRSIEQSLAREEIRSAVSQYVDIFSEYVPSVTSPESNVYTGSISGDVIKQTAGDEYRTLSYFVCGSPAFVSVVRNILQTIGVSQKHIYYEDFGFYQ